MELKITSDHTHHMGVPSQEHTEAVSEHSGLKSLLMKRTAAAKLIGIGDTLFNELGDPKHRNYDQSFPKPVRRLTPKGPIFFLRDDIVAWVSSLATDCRSAKLAANDAAFESRV